MHHLFVLHVMLLVRRLVHCHARSPAHHALIPHLFHVRRSAGRAIYLRRRGSAAGACAACAALCDSSRAAPSDERRSHQRSQSCIHALLRIGPTDARQRRIAAQVP